MDKNQLKNMEEYNKEDIVIAKCGHITYIGKYLEKLTEIYRLTDWIPISRITDSKMKMVGGFDSIVRKATKEEINQYLGIKKEEMETIPEKWVIKQNTSEEVCQWFRQFGNTVTAKVSGYFKYLKYFNGVTSYETQIPNDYTEITLQQFKKHILKEKEMNKKIIGYKAPMDLFGGLIKKDTLYVKDPNGYNPETYYPNKYKSYDSAQYKEQFPAEIVEQQWEPCYENEFKVGNVLYVEKYIESASQSGDLIEITAMEASSIFEYWIRYKNLKTGLKGAFGKSHYEKLNSFRLATPEEIAKSKEKVIDMGSFKLKVTRDGIFHNSENILDFAQQLTAFYQNLPQKFGKYHCIVKEIKFDVVGCQCGTTLKDWQNVLGEYEKLQ